MSKKLIKREQLNEFGKVYTKIVKQVLETNTPYPKKASGNLINSFKVVVSEEDGKDVITIEAEPYYKFVDKGVSGTIRKYNTPYSYKLYKPRIEAIRQWVRIKGMSEDAVFPIRNKIFRFGIKPTNFISKALKEVEFMRKTGVFEESITKEIIDMAKKTFGVK